MRRSALPLAALALLAELLLLSYGRGAAGWHLAVHAAALVAGLTLGLTSREVAPRLSLLAMAAAAAGLLALDAGRVLRAAPDAEDDEHAADAVEDEARAAVSAFEGFFASQR